MRSVFFIVPFSFSIRRRHRVLGVYTPKKFGRLRQTNDVLATFKKQRNGGGKGANNENKKRTERRYNTVKCNGASQSSLRKNRAINHRGDLKMNKDKRVTVRFTKKRI